MLNQALRYIKHVAVWLAIFNLAYPTALLATPFYGFHTAQTSDTHRSHFLIDEPILAYQPQRLFFVTPIASDTAAFTDPVAAVYERSIRGSEPGWRLVSLSGDDIPPGAEFMVVAVDPREESGAFVHTHGENSDVPSRSPYTVLDHPQLNGDPEAHFIIGHRVNQVRLAGVTPAPVVAEYVAPHWRIRTADGSPIPRGYEFNILVNEGILQTAVSNGRFVRIDDARLAGRPSTEMIVTPVVDEGQPYLGGEALFYNEYEIAGRLEKDVWTVLRQPNDRTKVRYNVFAPNLGGERRYKIFTAGPEGWKEDYFVGAMPMVDPLEPSGGNLVDLDAVSFDADLDLSIYETIPDPSGLIEPMETAVRHRTAQGTNLTKYLQNEYGQNLGTFTLTDGMLMTVMLDLDLDGLVDHVATHNLWTGRSKYIVAETEEALRNWAELLEGINTFCQMPEVTAEPGGTAPLVSLGSGVPASTIINGCNPLGGSGAGGGGFSGGSQIGGGGIGAICEGVLAGAGSGGAPDAVSGYGVGIAAGGALVAGFGLFLLSSNPVGWTVAAVGGAVLVVGGAVTVAAGIGINTTETDVANEVSALQGIVRRATQLRDQQNRIAAEAGEQRDRAIASENFYLNAGDRAGAERARSRADDAEARRISAEIAAAGHEEVRESAERDLQILGSAPLDPSGDGRNGALEFCQRYEANKDCYSFAGLERNLAIARNQCDSPVASTGGNLGASNITEGQCPFFPLDPRGEVENSIFCAEPETFFDMGNAVREMCINPVATPGPDGGGKCPSTNGTIGGASVDYTYLGVASPDVELMIELIKDMVVNPGDPIYFEPPPDLR
ncbi:hypothetical protein JMM59_14130 [Rhodovulum sulfidophilum]|uniref:DUF7452 domain-containing protein n=1 Tax=Rhodovulum sulfidophilum TaxID=35806 RepID=UPI001924B881|nr:hypothetical protein [Rhodovulum sulfidophilum]MBL3566133.1 hypothetical protein [Rhodovulum sulfidophilum]